MKKYKCNDYYACGQRIKSHAAEKKLKRSDMLSILHYEKEETISAIYSGKSISDDVIEILSNLWGLRIDYLLCNDDYPTEEDKYNFLLLKEQKEFLTAINYLKSIGYEFNVGVYWICSPAILHERIDDYKPYISNKDTDFLKYCIEKLDNFDITTPLLFHLRDFSIKDFLFKNNDYASYLDFEDFISFDNMLFDNTKSNNRAIFKSGVLFDNSNFLDKLQVLYDVKFNNKHIDYISLDYAKVLFKNIDDICRCSIQSMLSYSAISSPTHNLCDNTKLDLYKTLDRSIICNNENMPFS